MNFGADTLVSLRALWDVSNAQEAAGLFGALDMTPGLIGFVEDLTGAVAKTSTGEDITFAEEFKDGRHHLIVNVVASNEEGAREAHSRLGRLLAGSDQRWAKVKAVLATAPEVYRFSGDAKARGMETFAAKECPPQLSYEEKRNVIRTYRDRFALTTEEVMLLLRAIRNANYSLKVWKRLPDTAHNQIAMRLMQRHLPGVDWKKAVLLQNPHFVSGAMPLKTGMIPNGEFDKMVQKMMLRHWDLVEHLTVTEIQLVHVCCYLDREFRVAFHQLPRSLGRLDRLAQMAIGLGVRSMDLLKEIPTDSRKKMQSYWGTGWCNMVAVLEGRVDRLATLPSLTEEMRKQAYEWARKQERLQVQNVYGGFWTPRDRDRLVFSKHHIVHEVVAAILDGLNPDNPHHQPLIEERIRQNLEPFNHNGGESPIMGDETTPSIWLASWRDLFPTGDSLIRARRSLKQNGFQPRSIFELNASTHNRLIRGEHYIGVALADGRILTALRTDESMLHLFFKLHGTVSLGDWFKDDELEDMRRQMSEPLRGAACEFDVDEDGTLRLVNQSGAYRTPFELMDNVMQMLELKGIPHRLNFQQWQPNGTRTSF